MKWTLLILIFVTLSLTQFFYIPQKQTKGLQIEKQVLASKDQEESERLPVRLKIPSIQVNAAIEYVGVTSKGEMGVPSNSVDVGWFKLGVHPGKVGSAVIAGHLDGENGKSGVFTDLNKLKEGDKLYVEDVSGETTSFVVRKSRIYYPGYAYEIFNSSDKSHLNLITCDGAWNGAKKSYSKRLVVFADIEQ